MELEGRKQSLELKNLTWNKMENWKLTSPYMQNTEEITIYHSALKLLI